MSKKPQVMSMAEFNEQNPSSRAIPPEIDPMEMPEWYQAPNGRFIKATKILHSLRVKQGLKPWTGEGLPPGVAEADAIAARANAKRRRMADERAMAEHEAIRQEIRAEVMKEMAEEVKTKSKSKTA